MARIRSVKPEYFTHPEIVACSIPARLLLISLFDLADDDGRLYDQPRKIGGNSFGENDDVNVPELLAELHCKGRIVRYEADGKSCIQIVNFEKHQAIPPSKHKTSSLPPPPKRRRAATDKQHESSTKSAVEQTGGSEKDARKGKEGSGEEGKGKTLAPAKPSRERDPLFEAVAEVCGLDWRAGLTSKSRGSLNAAVKELRDAGAEPDEVQRRASNWPFLFERATLTPHALVKHWPQLAQAPPSRERPDRFVRMGQELQQHVDRMREEVANGHAHSVSDQARRSLPPG